MVFEHLASFFVDKFLGNYIENFDSDQLKINLWKGDITLENVYLKTNALNDLNVPLEIITGYLEKLKIHVPWTHLYSHPTKIELDGFYLLVSPKTDINYDCERAEKEAYDQKMKQVKKVEDFREEKEKYELNKLNPHHKDTFFERLQFHILRNVEITIKNIHIAFDDKTTKSYPFQFGIQLHSIKLNTTNSSWEDIQSKEDSKRIYKIGEINNLSIYWNSNIKSRLDLNKDQILDDLRLDKTIDYTKVNYILQPLNVRAKLKISKTAEEQDFEETVLDAQIDVDQIYLNINKNQYLDLLDLLEFEDNLNMKKKYIKYYSIINQNQNEKLSIRRWKFAYEVIRNEFIRPRLSSFKWINIKENIEKYKKYHQLYFQQLNHTFTKQHKHQIQELEKQIDAFNLIYIRRTAQIEYKKKKIEEKEMSWWDKLTNWWSSDSDQPEFHLSEQLTDDEKMKFYKAIGYKEVDSKDQLIYPQEYVDINTSIKLNLIQANVWSFTNQKDSNLKLISRGSISNTELQFQRRPARDDISLIVDIDSIEMCGIDDDQLNKCSPILIEGYKNGLIKTNKLLHLEFETNPINCKSDYKIKGLSQPLQITYHALTINKLIECFLPDRPHDLEGIKEAALSIYTDIKNRTQFLVSENLKKIEDLDINIDLQSIYFIIPINGKLNQSSPLICLDLGQLKFKGGENNILISDEETFHDAKTNLDNEKNFPTIPIEIQLEKIQLLYLNENENWNELCLKDNSPSHLIKPITITLDVFKSIIIDNPKIPIWKAHGDISSIESDLSDTRLFGFIKLLKSIPLPQINPIDEKQDKSKKYSSKENKKMESTKETYDSIEKMTSIKKLLNEQEKEEEKEKELNSNDQHQQIIQLKASFTIEKINILFKRALIDLSDYTEDFLEIYFYGIVLSTKIETYDIQFNGYLQDFQIIHQQFLTNDQEKLNIISKKSNSNFFTINSLLTSTTNPQFSSSIYNSIENNIHINVTQILLNIQLEPLSSIINFIQNIQNKLNHLPKNTLNYSKTQVEPTEEKKESSSSFKINFKLDELSLLIGNNSTQIIYFQLKMLNGYLCKTSIELSLHLILEDLFLIDLYPKSIYEYIIKKENLTNDFINLDLTLFNYPINFKKKPKDNKSFIKGNIQKLYLIFLYKHIDLINSFINSFQSNQKQDKSKSSSSSNEPNFILSTIQKYEENSLEFYSDFTLNAPNIFIPFNSFSKEGFIIDLGKLSINTNLDQLTIIEKHLIKYENISINRILFNEKDQINLLETSPFIISIHRHLNLNDKKDLFIQIQWDQIDFKLGKTDYAAIQKVIQLNFNEKLFFQIPNIQIDNQQDQQEEEEDDSNPSIDIDMDIKKNNSLKIRLDLLIKEISLSIYPDNKDNEYDRNDTSKFLYLTIETIKANFQQLSDSTYNAKFQISNLFADDQRQSEQFSRLINKGFLVDQQSPLIITNINYKLNNTTVNGQMESFHILISTDMINSISEFFIYEIPSKEQNKQIQSLQKKSIQLNIPSPAKSISQYSSSSSISKSIKTNNKPQTSKHSSSSSSLDNDLKTTVQFIVKPSQLILIEDQKNIDSNCLIFNFSMLINLINNIDQTKISASIKDFSFYGSNFEQLKKSEIRYSIINPSEIDAMIMLNSNEQKIDLNIGDLSVNIDPILIRTFVSLQKSIKKQEDSQPKEGKEKINSKSIFQPKPFKDSSFWFIQDVELKEEIIEETDILKLTTGDESSKTNDLKQKEKDKSIEQNKYLQQQLIINLKIIEVKLELGNGSSTRPVVALCLSELFVDIQNWSSDILISSSIQIELALFNDHLLAWEPLIEPIINQLGIVQSPFTINCHTIQEQDNDNDNDDQNRYLLNDDEKDDSLPSTKSLIQDSGINIDIKKLIYIRAEHLLNLTITKSTIDLIQRIQNMFNNAYENGQISDEDKKQSILSIHNQTGFNIYIKNIIGIKVPKDKKCENDLIELKIGEELQLNIPDERLNATHLPVIAEQISKRKQQFQIQINNKSLTVDINQTWRRVYEIGLSSNPLWPIQLLCDSQIFEERRRVILSSIIKISNRTEMPLILLDADSIETNKFNSITKINPNDEFYLPLSLLYSRITSRLYFSIQQENTEDEIKDFISFDWANESTSDRTLKLNNGKQGHFVIYKEEIESYSENTDEPLRKSFNIYVKLALHILNLLPIQIQCLIDNVENILLKPSKLYHTIEGHKKSILRFTIDEYNNSTWISDEVNLNEKGHGNHNEHIITFYDKITNETLRMVGRIDIYRGSYRLSFYSPFWIVNATDLKFQFKIDNEKIFIDNIEQPYLICPKKFNSESHKKKGHIRLFSIEEDENISQWSEGFSLDVIKSTGITSCKVNNDRNYMVTIDILTTSFGMTKIVTLAPSTAIINNSTIDLEVTENVSGTGDDNWKLVKANQIIPFWPRYIKEGILCVRYFGNINSANCFSIKDKHRTLLKVDDIQRPAIHVEVSITDFDGYKVIFGDYKTGDAPILIVNALINQNISFSQKDDLRTQLLPSQYYVYYTWIDPFKPRELNILSNGNNKTIEIIPACGFIDKENEERIYYGIFHDGPQTVLLFSNDTSIVEAVSDMPSMSESMKDYIQISIHSIGISLINDINRDDLLYITINQSKELWTETRKFNVKPLGPKLNLNLEENYKKYLKQFQNNEKKQEIENKYQIDKHRFITFDGDIGEISDENGNSVHIKREILDGFWIGYTQSISNKAIHLRINNIQIDDQLQITLFPSILYPIVSKAAATDIPGKPFIELSIFKRESTRSNTIHIKYFKLLIQEFVFRADQGLILGLMTFFQEEKNLSAPTVDMSEDLKRIDKPLETLIRGESEDNTSEQTKFYFDNLHLSPLKIHVSFSMHGSKASEQLLAEYPIVDFLLQTLNVAEVQDVILKLNFFERKNDRYSIDKLLNQVIKHYENQFLKQIHVVVLGLDVLGNPFGVMRGVAEGVESFFYEPYKGAMEGPIEFIEGIAAGTQYLVGSVVGGAAGALSKISGAASKGLAQITLDKDYQNTRIQKKEIQSQTTPEIISSGKNVLKDIKLGIKGVVRKPKEGAKEGGAKGFVKGLGKGFLGLIGRPTSGIADLTSTSFNLIKRVAAHEEIIHRIRNPRHIGRDGLVRPSIAHETLGNYIFDQFGIDKHTEHEGYIAHINSSSDPATLFFATTKRILFLIANNNSSNDYKIEWDHQYKDIKGIPTVKYQPDFIEITLKETNAVGMTKKDSIHVKVIPYQSIGEARYIVDKINETTTVLEV